MLTSFPSVVGYQQVKSAKSQDIKEMLQAIKVSPNYEKSFGGFYLTIALIHLILYLIFTGLSGAGFFNLFNFLKGIFFALTWPLEDISILALAIFFIILFIKNSLPPLQPVTLKPHMI